MNQSKQNNSKQNNSQNKPKVPQYYIHENASDSVKEWLKAAQKRLELFANMPNQREAYEQELMSVLDHNTVMKNKEEEGYRVGLAEGKAEGLAEGKAEGLAEGKAEGLAEGVAEGRQQLLPLTIEVLQASGFNDEEIRTKLNLTPEESSLYLDK